MFDSRRLHEFPNHLREVAERRRFCALLVPQLGLRLCGSPSEKRRREPRSTPEPCDATRSRDGHLRCSTPRAWR
jgi:hypothetical protein